MLGAEIVVGGTYVGATGALREVIEIKGGEVVFHDPSVFSMVPWTEKLPAFADWAKERRRSSSI